MEASLKRFLIIFLFIIPSLCTAQNTERKHDSIMQRIQNAPDDSTKAVHYLNLGDLYAYSHQDSAIGYYQQAFNYSKEGGYTRLAGKCLNYIAVVYIYRSEYDKTIDYLNRSIDLRKQANDTGGMANGYNNLGVIYKNQGDFGKALEYFQKTARLRQAMAGRLRDSAREKNNTEKLGQANNNLGNIYYQFGDYSRAVSFYRQSLEYFEQIDDTRGISSCYNNIGNVFEEQQKYDRALEYYSRSLDLNRSLGEVRHIGTCLNNIGEIYLKQNQIGKAREYFRQSLEYRQKSNDKRGISAVYSNLAMANLKMKNYQQSLDQLHKALKLDNETGDKKAMAEDMISLAKVYFRQGRMNQAGEFARRGQQISESIQAPLQKKSALEILARISEKRGDYQMALHYTQRFEDIEDRLFNKEKNQQIEELETRYQLEKQQQEIQRQEELIDHKEALIRKQKVRQYAYIAVIFFFLIISGLIGINYRQKRRANKLLTGQNEEIESQNEELMQQNEEIRNQRDELERQRTLAHDQRNELALKKDEITSGIRYARCVQSNLLMSERSIRQLLPDYFVWFKPRYLAGGDFYWLHQAGDQVMIAVADCTGHGASGAFLSLLGMSLLDQVVQEDKQGHAGEILNRLRTKMVHALFSENPDSDRRSRMDISLCIWDRQNQQLQFSGAHRPLYRVRGGELTEYKGQRMTIGLDSRLEEAFSTQYIELQSGDMIYLFTDGYSSQLKGGQFTEDRHEKMNVSRFKQLIQEVAPLETREQKQSLQRRFDQWKGTYEQVDDVLVMGIRF